MQNLFLKNNNKGIFYGKQKRLQLKRFFFFKEQLKIFLTEYTLNTFLINELITCFYTKNLYIGSGGGFGRVMVPLPLCIGQ